MNAMQEASTIFIRLIDLQQPCSEETAQAVYYSSMTEAVKGFERIRSHATQQDNGSYAAQTINCLGFSTSHAA
jgi:hypothetical protein